VTLGPEGVLGRKPLLERTLVKNTTTHTAHDAPLDDAARSSTLKGAHEPAPLRTIGASAISRPRFVAYDVALDLLRALRPVVEQLKSYNADLADQVTRAGTSLTLNLQEGSGRTGRDRKRFFSFARGSAREIMGALDTADAWGWRVETGSARALLDRELALLWGLCR
jgi:four helix bundle protein